MYWLLSILDGSKGLMVQVHFLGGPLDLVLHLLGWLLAVSGITAFGDLLMHSMCSDEFLFSIAL